MFSSTLSCMGHTPSPLRWAHGSMKGATSQCLAANSQSLPNMTFYKQAQDRYAPHCWKGMLDSAPDIKYDSWCRRPSAFSGERRAGAQHHSPQMGSGSTEACSSADILPVALVHFLATPVPSIATALPTGTPLVSQQPFMTLALRKTPAPQHKHCPSHEQMCSDAWRFRDHAGLDYIGQIL